MRQKIAVLAAAGLLILINQHSTKADELPITSQNIEQCQDALTPSGEPIKACKDERGIYRVFPPDPAYVKELQQKREEAAAQARAAAAEKQKAEAQAAAQSPALKKINSQYPGLANRSLAPLDTLVVRKFILCMEQNKDAANWDISRDQGGVHITGLLYQQAVALEFVDHGDYLEIIGARYGDRVSLTESDATTVLLEIAGRCI